MSEQTAPSKGLPAGVIAIIPLLLLALLTVAILKLDPTGAFRGDVPPIEDLAFQRVVLTPGHITAEVMNAGPDPLTIAQVQVDEAYWTFEVSPSKHLDRFDRATISLAYPWVEGEAHEVVVLTATGTTFGHEIAVAVETPQMSAHLLGLFALLGVYVGVIPVALGLMWFPAIRKTSQKWVDFFLFLTIGLLVFLGVDALEDALELAHEIPGAFQGVGLLVIGFIGAFAVLTASGKLFKAGTDPAASSLALAYLIATGIGLHNLSEGLAIGAAYTLGNISLGTMLVLGFTLHNTTEGLAIVAPLARTRVALRHLLLLGLIGGGPTIIGTWLGGAVYSPVWALIFLAVGAGAIFQVVWQIAASLIRQRGSAAELLAPLNTAGLLAGLLIMYATGLLVAA